jgi:hypothetical protein
MTLTTLSRSTVEPLRRSPARARFDDAMAELRRAVAAIDAEDRERAAARERAWQETEAKVERRVRLAAAREATKALRLEVPTRWFWSFANDALDDMRTLASEARRQGEQGRAQALDARLDAALKELNKIQKTAR